MANTRLFTVNHACLHLLMLLLCSLRAPNFQVQRLPQKLVNRPQSKLNPILEPDHVRIDRNGRASKTLNNCCNIHSTGGDDFSKLQNSKPRCT